MTEKYIKKVLQEIIEEYTYGVTPIDADRTSFGVKGCANYKRAIRQKNVLNKIYQVLFDE